MRTRVGFRSLCLGAWLLAAQGVRAQDASVPAPAPAEPAGSAAGDQEAEQERAMQALDQEARQHFQLGRTFYDSGRFQQAAEEFEAAYRLSGRPQLLYNLYVAHRDAGELDKAIESLRAYLDKVQDAPDRVNLKARLASMEQQAQRQAEQTARAEQAARAAESRDAAARAPKTRVERERSSVPWVLMGSGGALLVGSVVTGALALGKSKDLDKKCDGSLCPSAQRGAVDSTRTLAITTDVLWGVGAASALTGLVLWWTGALDREREVPIALGIGGGGFVASYGSRF